MKITIISALTVVCFVSIRVLAQTDQVTVNIGGLFNRFDRRQAYAFEHAAYLVNNDPSTPSRFKLKVNYDHLTGDDSFEASKKTCGLIFNGSVAMFGPQPENSASHVQSICNTVHIPHIQSRMDYSFQYDVFSINLYPHPSSLGKAYLDILTQLQWKKFVILYDTSEGLIRLQNLLKEPSMNILVRYLPEGETADYRPLLKQIKKDQLTHIVLDVVEEKIPRILQHAKTIGLVNDYTYYFITSLDFNLVDLEPFRYTGVNITGIQLIDPKSEDVQSLIKDWRPSEYGANPITTEIALLYDSVWLFRRSLDELHKRREIRFNRLHCETDIWWEDGRALIDAIRTYGAGQDRTDRRHSIFDTDNFASHFNRYDATPFEQSKVKGLSGDLKFDASGFRTDFTLEILEMDPKDVLKKVGLWTLQGANYTRTWKDAEEAVEQKLQNRTLAVSVALSKPYVMLKHGAEEPVTTDNVEGFCIELIDEIAKIKNFNYTFQGVYDGNYGSRNRETGEWNGIVRELIDHKADLGIVDFTITYERESAVDFSMPFMNLGISILYKKPVKKDANLLAFTEPFSVDVWMFMGTAYLGVSILLFIMARMSPEEWQNPYPCIEEPEELENCFTLINSLWFTIATFLCQGADIAPSAISTRIVAGIWWFFTLIMISSYTANLAAFLTVAGMTSPIESAEDLAKQMKIKYGCKLGGSTYNFFRDSNIPTYQRMWATMSNIRPSVFTKDNDLGIERVSKANGQYAFLMESSTIEYQVERKCDLMQVGNLLDSKSYGIALPPGSPYTGAISSAILKLKENGKLPLLKKKWWKEERIVKACETGEKEDPASAAELGLENVGGVFVVMAGGFGMSCIIACIEFAWKARKLAMDQHVSFTEELGKELLFIINCSENSKPVRKKTSGTETESSSLYGSSSSSYGYADKK